VVAFTLKPKANCPDPPSIPQQLPSEPPPSLLGGVDQCVEVLLEDEN
jgi:hypothetical protein